MIKYTKICRWQKHRKNKWNLYRLCQESRKIRTFFLTNEKLKERMEKGPLMFRKLLKIERFVKEFIIVLLFLLIPFIIHLISRIRRLTTLEILFSTLSAVLINILYCLNFENVTIIKSHYCFLYHKFGRNIEIIDFWCVVF